jgi:multicomponent Na+:H+ antiporter subunit F
MMLEAYLPRTLEILLGIVVLALGVATVRLLRGPTRADRAMAMDVLVIAAVAGVALMAWRVQVVALLDVAVAVAMVTFISAVALAWYLERRGKP